MPMNNDDPGQWKATRLVDERTGNSCIGIDFPRRQAQPGFEIFDDDLVEQPGRIRSLLKRRGAMFTGTKAEQIRFIQRLLKAMPSKPFTLAMKPGLRGSDGFVLGKRMLGTAIGSFRWRSPSGASDQGEIGNRSGIHENWNEHVGNIALKSTFLTFGLCLPLACPLPGYVLAHRQQRLLSETAVFNLSGDSGSGKTSIARAAAGVFGPPGLLRKWDFSRRGVEEYCESRNDLLAILDDMETHTEEAGSLRTAMRNVTQIIPSGQSKLISTIAEIPSLTWVTFGLTTSPEPVDTIAERLDWKRTDGQCARFIDIAVPKVEQAGIFDQLDGDPLEKIKTGKQLIQKLDDGVTKNFGLLMLRWLNLLVKDDLSSLLLKRRDSFLQRILSNSTGFDERYAVKFAIPAIAGYSAAANEIVPWPKMWPVHAAEHCYYLAVNAVRRDADVAAKKLRLIANLADDPIRFVPTKSGTAQPVLLDGKMLGFRTSYHGRDVLAFRDGSLDAFAGTRKVRALLLERLQKHNLLLGGHGHAGTTQLPLPVVLDGRVIRKPRFWIINLKRLLSAASPGA